MKNLLIKIWICAAVAVAMTAVSCSKDEDGGSLSFDVPAIYLSGSGDSATVSFSAKGVSKFYISSKPTGWGDDNVVLDAEKKTLTITIPEASDDESVVLSGTITIGAYSAAKKVKTASIYVGVVPEKQLEGPANSFIANEKETNYWFTPLRSDGKRLELASIGLIWQSASKLVQYLYYDEIDNRVSFYIGADATYTDEVMCGNALIGAYDADGALLWSWHIWSCGYDPESDFVEWSNGSRMMTRNLGALDNDNSTNAEKLASYGLYYQWGRKEPFIGPADYKFSYGISGSLYISDYTSTNLKYVASSAETGTDAYAVQNPLTFILGVEETGYDWRWDAVSGSWSKLYDPCPAGWRVAPASAFEGLELAGDLTDADYEAYGWPLEDEATSSSLFMAGGYRTYLTGYFQNVYQPVAMRANTADEAQPWVGYYWTSDAGTTRNAETFYFWYDKKNVTGGQKRIDAYRANGCSVRCVKE